MYFFLHSRLLERAANLKTGGSLTALPIIETIQGDVSAYIPTNVISITDGQIFLETELFSRGIRPAVSPGLSVSRVGSAAQNKVIKNMAGDLKLWLAQFREVEGFAKLGLVLDEATMKLVEKGKRLTSFLVQKRYKPAPIYEQILCLYPSLKDHLINIPINMVANFEKEFLNWYYKSSFNKVVSSTIISMKFPENLINFILWHFIKNYIIIIVLKLETNDVE